MAELERLKIKLERGKITCREFLSRVSAMGLAATAPALYTSTAMADKVQHGPLAANWDMDGDKFIEKWWFA